jgi:hypothetical protein
VIWLWVALWVVLILGAVAVLGLLGRDVYRKGKVLAKVAAVETERLTLAMAPLQEAADRLEEQREEPAVFADPTELRRERAKAAKGKGGALGRRSNGRHRSDPGTAARLGATSR